MLEWIAVEKLQAYLNEIVDEENGNEQDSDLEAVKVESHGRGCCLSKTAPADDDHEWKNE